MTQITLLQKVWDSSELSVDILGTNRILKIRNDKGGGGTIMLWKDDALVQASVEKSINMDSVIAKFIVAGNR